GGGPQPDPGQLRAVGAVLDGLPPLSAGWRRLVAFAAGYYQRSLGEVALAALPPQLRGLDAEQLARRLQRKAAAAVESVRSPAPTLTDEQAQALAAIAAEPGPFLLFG